MGVIELVTIASVILKLLGVIDVSWTYVLLPEYVTIVFYIDWIILQAWRFRRMRRKKRKQN